MNVNEELTLTPNGGDCTTFFYTLTVDYTVPSDYPGAGDAMLVDTVGPNFGSCPSSSWNQDIFNSVTVAQIKKRNSDNPASACFVAANGVGATGQPAPLIEEGKSFTAFQGLEFPFTALPPKLNFVPAGLSAPFFAPLTFDYLVTDVGSPNATFLPEAIPISCSTRLPLPLQPVVPLSGQLVNLTQTFPRFFPVENGLTEYLFKWNTAKGAKGCVRVVFTFENGPSIVVPEEFEYFSF